MISGILILTAFIVLLYLVIIGRCIKGWYALPVTDDYQGKPDVMVSVIIPFRNEEEILHRSTIALINQDYPSDLFEVIYVNDHSDDDSVKILIGLLKEKENFRVIHSKTDRKGKKAALIDGVNIAGGDLLLFTDADCFPVPSWIRTMAGFYKEKEPVMISGPVLMNENDSLFSKIQSLELLSLTGAGGGSFGAGAPVLCSGANLGFNRGVFINQMKAIKEQIASGDDIFMMLSLKSAFLSRMHFIKSKNSIVNTEPMERFADFLRQRIRWASKARFYRDSDIIITALSVMLINILLLCLFLGGFSNPLSFYAFSLVFILKSLIDLLLLSSVSTFFQKQKLAGLFLPVQVIYPFYAIISGIGGLFIKTKWKDRK